METENFQPEKENREFRKGILAGILGTLLIVMLITIVGTVFWEEKHEIVPGTPAEEKEEAQTSQEAVADVAVRQKTEQIAALLDQYYYEAIDKPALVENMYAGIVDGVGDIYTTYYTAEEYRSQTETIEGTYYGIGAVLTQHMESKKVTILHVYPGTPAEEAGVKDGDILVKVEDIEGNSMELSELVKHIKGEEGTTVHLQLLREGEAGYLELDVERRQIEVPTVEYEMLDEQTGLIQISEFLDNTPEQFSGAVKELQAQGMTSMVVDLRNNPGGSLDAVCRILDEILPEGIMVYTEDKYGSRKDYTSDEAHLEIPMAVLINENSASASEIFAGAIKDYKYGTLIGTTTFGKGIVQAIIPLGDGSAVKVTIAKYFTPKGNYIHEVGIKPDIELKYEYQGDVKQPYEPMQDNQVLKAVETFKGAETR